MGENQSPSLTQVQLVAGKAVRQFLCIVMVAAALIPLYFVVVSALKTDSEYGLNMWGLPQAPTFANFVNAVENDYLLRWVGNSVLLSVTSVLAATVVSCLAAYTLAQYDIAGKDVIFGGIVSLLVIPPVVLIIPLFKLMVSLHLINTYPSVFLIYVGVMLPLAIYLLTSFFKSIPGEIIDAARVDGCGSFQILYRIIVPISRPAILTTILVSWLYAWNEVLVALIFLQNDEMHTLMAGLAVFKAKYVIHVPLIMSGIVVAIVPTLVLYAIGQQFFVRGLTAGSTKG